MQTLGLLIAMDFNLTFYSVCFSRAVPAFVLCVVCVCGGGAL